MTLHIALHGFRGGRGMGNAALEAKFAHKLAGIAHEVLLQVFLDVQNAYDSLDRLWCMEILWGYGMEQQIARLITHHWDNLMFVPKGKRFLGMPFGMGRVVMQGDPVSPIILNIVVYMVMIATLEVV